MILCGWQNWSWFVWRAGDFVSSTANITVYYGVKQIKKCDMYSVYNRQERGRIER